MIAILKGVFNAYLMKPIYQAIIVVLVIIIVMMYLKMKKGNATG